MKSVKDSGKLNWDSSDLRESIIDCFFTSVTGRRRENPTAEWLIMIDSFREGKVFKNSFMPAHVFFDLAYRFRTHFPSLGLDAIHFSLSIFCELRKNSRHFTIQYWLASIDGVCRDRSHDESRSSRKREISVSNVIGSTKIKNNAANNSALFQVTAVKERSLIRSIRESEWLTSVCRFSDHSDRFYQMERRRHAWKCSFPRSFRRDFNRCAEDQSVSAFFLSNVKKWIAVRRISILFSQPVLTAYLNVPYFSTRTKWHFFDTCRLFYSSKAIYFDLVCI